MRGGDLPEVIEYARSLQTRRPTILLPSGSFDLQFIIVLRGFMPRGVVRFLIIKRKAFVSKLSHKPPYIIPLP